MKTRYINGEPMASMDDVDILERAFESLRFENADLREALKELIPIAEERLDDLSTMYHQTKDETVQEHGKKCDTIIRNAKALIK